MAIGTLAAIGIGLAGAGTAVSGIAKANAQKSAAKDAAAATTQGADAAAAVVERNYDKSAAALQPWQSQGLQANALINSALGLTPTQPAQSYGQPQATYQPAQGYQQQGYQQPNALSQFVGQPSWQRGSGMVEDYSYLAPNAMGDMSSNGGGWTQAGGYAPMQPQGQMGPTAAGGTVNTTVNPQSALDTFLNSTGYKFQLGEGMKALEGSWAGRGQLQSGAALKSFGNYAQGQAQQGYGQWLGALGNQQSLGANAASAQAGVSQDAGNSLASIYMNKGDNLANAALAGANSGTAGALGNALSLMGGGIFKMGG